MSLRGSNHLHLARYPAPSILCDDRDLTGASTLSLSVYHETYH